MKKKLLCMFLATAMTVGVFAGAVVAADEDTDKTQVEEVEDLEIEDADAEPVGDADMAPAEEVKEPETSEDLEIQETLPSQGGAEKIRVASVQITMGKASKGKTFADMEKTLKVKVLDEDGKEIKAKAEFEDGRIASPFYNGGMELKKASDQMTEMDRFYVSVLTITLEDPDSYCFYDASSTQVFLNGQNIFNSLREDVLVMDLNPTSMVFEVDWILRDENGNTEEPYYVDIPYSIEVKQGADGNVAPGKQTFKLKVDFKGVTPEEYESGYNRVDPTVSGTEITVNGAGTYKGVIRLTTMWKFYYKDMQNAIDRMTVTLQDVTEEGWAVQTPNQYKAEIQWLDTYAEEPLAAKEKLEVGSREKGWGGTYNLTFIPVDKNGVKQEAVDKMTFSATYTKKENKPAAQDKKPPTKDKTKKKTKKNVPATADNTQTMSWFYLMLLAGAALTVTAAYRKSHR